MLASSAVSRIRDFTSARVDSDCANRWLHRCGTVYVAVQYLCGTRSTRETVVDVWRSDGATVDLQHDVVALNSGVVGRAQRIDAGHDHTAHAAGQAQSARCVAVEIAHVQAQRDDGVARRPHGIRFVERAVRLPRWTL